MDSLLNRPTAVVVQHAVRTVLQGRAYGVSRGRIHRTPNTPATAPDSTSQR